ncbi:MAG TPA: hypothetical protein VFD48_07885 [Pyrinomonadaceae bacterium]|nr:hypothetical protein [Pyrinomonadaceae bacterium]
MNRQVNEPTLSSGLKARLPYQKKRLGHAALSEEERAVLDWSHERRLLEFQSVNDSVRESVCETKLMYIDTLAIDNGEILDILAGNPTLGWEEVRDVFLSGPIEGYTSTLHGLEEINYPKFFWKAIVENEREKLLAPLRLAS